ncbi:MULTISPECIES: hypothetical protein [unclassified Enterobacter cloacae complex]|uniref:hypothetical protein n=1 Tax=unclassified Enterobacter cloacae complex TaxID=2757714 RepID=UPI00100DB911|nr:MULTISPECIES: hypothetical protein [unclassified Enterobacter cloacae complex]MCE1514001.1 hypothetical protein [Enterobacter hormaechei]RYA49722.1 hypothetical protein DD597_14025 [Enterobacter cloacae complex sp. 677-3DZ2D5B]RYA66784.1 hypothetical protein DD599_00050 [Enterobacter cloacae complex sp. CH23B]RYA70332.1 hypothetical protein DD598_14535 [Enterobacter cloacae complex sp. 2DZ2F16B1]
MTFWNDSYQIEFDMINNYIRSECGDVEKIPNDLEMVSDEYLVDAVIALSWTYFGRLYVNRRDELNKCTQFNQRHLEDRARPSFEEIKLNKMYFLSNLLRVVYEYYFWNQDSYRTPSFISTRVLERLDKLTPSSEYNVQFIWIERSLPSAMIMGLLKSKDFDDMKKMANDVSGYEEKFTAQINRGIEIGGVKIEQYKTDIGILINEAESSKDDLQGYCDKLTEYKGDFNFVLLSKAFSNLLSAKKNEFKENSRVTRYFIFVLILIPALVFLNHVFNLYEVKIDVTAIAYYLPIFSLELLIFYFMRLYYIEGKAIKTQMLQVEQRLSLCEFIHDYVETKNKSSADKESWVLFEKLIFSPIQLSSENIPSLLDGAATVAELAGKVIPKEGK